MFYRGRVRPSKPASVMAMVVGGIFIVIGVTTIVPSFGMFGIIWTLIAIAMTGYHAYNVFSKRGAAEWEIDVDARGGRGETNGFGSEPRRYADIAPKPAETNDFDAKLRKLDGLRRDGLITEEEFDRKRKELLEQKW